MNTVFRIASRHGLAWLVVVLLSAGLIACNRAAPAPDAPKPAASPSAAAEKPATPAAAVYVCPMHPHIQQHGPGICPICGMTLEKKVGAALQSESPSTSEEQAKTGAVATEDRRILYYYDPMRPEVHFDQPGQSPFMDMALVPKYADAGKQPAGISVNAEVVQSLGIRTATPVRRDVRPKLRVPARVVADARGQARLQARVDGWIERLLVRAVGQSVVAGSVVAEIYSPELVQAQEELLLGTETAGPARERLRRFGIADRDIDAIQRAGNASRRLPLRAPVGGVVTELGVREGSSVTPETLIVDIAGRNAVWIEAQLFPVQRSALGSAMSAHFTLPGQRGEGWRSGAGTVVPVVDPVTQTLAVRFPVVAAEGLPLGMVLDAEIEGDVRTDVLLVPMAAVIRTAQGDRVLLAQDGNRFVPTRVQLGPRYGDELEITAGLAVTDRIVTSGQFLLDAEASLSGGLDQMTAAPASDATP